MKTSSALHVLIVDDSAVVRNVLASLLSQSGMEVATASDPIIAIAKMKSWHPDVIVLDLEMPRMDGLTFLRHIMSTNPLPVVICSSHADHGSQNALRALDDGAVDIVSKPKVGIENFLFESGVMLVDTIQAAAHAKVKRSVRKLQKSIPGSLASKIARIAETRTPTETVVAIGASTGGTEALRQILQELDENCPGVVIVLHMPEGFTRSYAEHLNQQCPMHIKEAVNGDEVLRGQVLLAPGNKHMMLRRSLRAFFVEVSDGPLVSRHRPSVDVLFQSVAKAAGKNAVGVILTGMGSDGADGLLDMKRAGAATVAQNQASSIVFGMPKEAIARGGVDEIVPLGLISATILKLIAKNRSYG